MNTDSDHLTVPTNRPESLSEAVGDLRVWWIPQVPMEPFYVPVADVREARLILDALARYDLFQLDHRIKPDYCNAGGLMVYEADGGDGIPEWCEWYSADGESIDDIKATGA